MKLLATEVAVRGASRFVAGIRGCMGICRVWGPFLGRSTPTILGLTF